MKLNEYQELALKTARQKINLKERLIVAGLGIAGEAGEVADLIKKYAGHGHELKSDEIKKELGDVLWYIAEISKVVGFTLEEVAEENVEKLKRRYPAGFEAERSINRR